MLGRSDQSKAPLKRNGRSRAEVIRFAVAFFVFFAALAVLPSIVRAQGVDLGIEYATATGLATTDVRVVVGNVIKAFLGFLGLLVVGLFVYAGFLWMTSGGDPGKLRKAKQMIMNAVIGLIIIIASYAIVSFIFRAVTGEGLGITGPSGTTPLSTLYAGGRTSEALGSGIIDYHYPEIGQTDVPRNTKISIAFKRPFVLSTVFRDYDDKGTYDTGDDTMADGSPVVPEDLELNTDNFRLIPNQDLGMPESGNVDEQFDERYPDEGAVVDPAPKAGVTFVGAEFDPEEGQALVIRPVEWIGSPSVDMNYRMALRGGANGIKVWVGESGTGEPYMDDAFLKMYPDGSYFWVFTTGTMADTTPPKIRSIYPAPRASLPGCIGPDPDESCLDRNQLLQIYFDEAVDPTTASGRIGTGGGFTIINIEAKCISGADCDPAYVDWAAVDGEVKLANRFRTAEFKPGLPCDNAPVNSCGETVYCLPRNVELRVSVKAATVGSEPPMAVFPEDGVVDMVGNSFDGNKDGTADGPGYPYDYNNPPPAGSGAKDSATWRYRVGNTVDLVPPVVTDILPKSVGGTVYSSTEFEEGPSKVPVDQPVIITWNKVLSTSSIRTGGFDEARQQYTDPLSSVVLRARELVRDAGADCSPGGACESTPLDSKPWFVAEASLDDPDYPTHTVLTIRHRNFFTGNDLGYMEDEIAVNPDKAPKYAPVVRWRIKDSRQNCFWPSIGYDCSQAAMKAPGSPQMTSCCEQLPQSPFNCSP